MREVWKDIEGYEGVYMVSNLGNVKSLNYCNSGHARNLTPKVNNVGRLWVELHHNRKKQCFLIHRLVAMAFIENPDGYPQINHIDENPKNNVVTNLEWCTGKQNVDAYWANHRDECKKPRVCMRRNSKWRDFEILQMTLDGTVVRRWNNVAHIYHETGYHMTSILECCKGVKRKKAYGFKWQFAV